MARTILRATKEWQKIISPSDKSVFMCNLSGTSILIYPTTEELYSTNLQIKHPYTIGGTIYQLKSKPEEYVYAKAIPIDGVEETVFPIITSDISMPALGIAELREDVNNLMQELGRALLRITNEEIKTIEHHEIFKRFQREFMDNEIKTDASIANLYKNLFIFNSKLLDLRKWTEDHKHLHQHIDLFLDDFVDIKANKENIEYMKVQIFAQASQLNALLGRVNNIEPALSAVEERVISSDLEKDRLIANLTAQLMTLNIRLFGTEAFLEEHKRLHHGIDLYQAKFADIESNKAEIYNLKALLNVVNYDIQTINNRINKNGGIENIVEALQDENIKQHLTNTNLTTQLLSVRDSLFHTQQVVEEHRRNHGEIDAYIEDFSKIARLSDGYEHIDNLVNALQSTSSNTVNRLNNLEKMEDTVDYLVDDSDKQKVINARITDQLLLVRDRLFKAQIFLEEHKRLHHGIDPFIDDFANIQNLEDTINYINTTIAALRSENSNTISRLNDVEALRPMVDELIDDSLKQKLTNTSLTTQLLLVRDRLMNAQIYLEEHKRTHQGIDIFTDDLVKIQELEDTVNNINNILNAIKAENSNTITRLNNVEALKTSIEEIEENTTKQNIVTTGLETQMLDINSRLFNAEQYILEMKRKFPNIEVRLGDVDVISLDEKVADNVLTITAITTTVNNIITKLNALENNFNSTVINGDNSVVSKLIHLNTDLTNLNSEFDSLNNAMSTMAAANTEADIDTAFNTVISTASSDMEAPLTALKDIILRIKTLEELV